MESQTGFSWVDVVFILGIFTVLVTGVAIVVWQIFATWRARMSVAREEAYRKLAEDATEAQRRTSDWIEKATVELAELRQRTAELERILKEVG
jgi:hypothetical protein